jgi:hypothetical protein
VISDRDTGACQTGLRRGELTSLKLGDVQIRDRSGKVQVREGKGQKERGVPLNAELIETAKDDHATGEVSHQPAVGLPRNLRPVTPDATSHNLGWVGLQAFRYRDSATNEIHWPPLSQHLLVLMTKPPAKMSFRYEGGIRDIRPPAGSIAVMPVGSVAEVCWQGTKDSFHIYLDPKLIARVATSSFELDLSRTTIPPLDALILPELRTTMLAVDAELTAGGLGGPLMICSPGSPYLWTAPASQSDGRSTYAPEAHHDCRLHYGEPKRQSDAGRNGWVGSTQPISLRSAIQSGNRLTAAPISNQSAR